MDDKLSGIERREHPRRSIPAAATCTFFKGDLQGKNSFRGFIQDISLGGACLEIRDDCFLINDSFLQYTHLELSFEMNTPEGTCKMNLSGIIKWYNKTKKKGSNLLFLGIQFYNISEHDKHTLTTYLTQSGGDKNLIWNLWDSLSHPA